MNRYLLTLSLICLFSNNAVYSHTEKSSESAKTWKKLKKEINNQKNSTVIDKNKVMRDHEKDFDELFPYNFRLTKQQLNAIFAIKCKCRNNMENRLNELLYTDEYAAKKDAKKQVKSCIADIARAKTECILANNGCNRETQRKFGEEEYEKAFSESLKFWGRNLSYLFDGTLEKDLLKKIKKLKNLSHKKEIYEIYPHENSPRREETLTKIRNEGHHRYHQCRVCFDEFEDIGKRINLVCGHSICAKCLYKNKYEYKDHRCPICRNHIYNEDFPAKYLQSHINS